MPISNTRSTTSTKRLSRAAAARHVARTRRAEAIIGRQVIRAMRRFFDGQARRVVRKWLAADGYLASDSSGEFKDPASQLIDRLEDSRIVTATQPYVMEMTITAVESGGEVMGVELVANAEHPIVLGEVEASAERVAKVNKATRKALQRSIVKGQEKGYTAREIAVGSARTRRDKRFKPISKVVGRPYLYKGRPECIARTEIAYASNAASLNVFAGQGMNIVEVADGPNCGWVTHDDPDKANGTERGIKDAFAHQLAHPNCVRMFLPVI